MAAGPTIVMQAPPAPEPPGLWNHIEASILTWAPILFMALICIVLWRTMKLMPRTKPQQIKPDSKCSIGWDEVAGADEAKAELQEVVEFLREPERFHELGATVPKGILLHGPPGTGKTLLAKAVAKESGAEFFSQSAAAFVEMFAGLGAARIRRLFAEARAHRPAVIFIDEIDAVGGERGSDNNSEREQTLNQLLVEMDGFNTTGDLVVIAASNLLDKLDAALLRPGRFDRQIFVSPPDVTGREAILRVHTRDKPLRDVDLELIARQTAGLTGADLANLCNEAAIFAARERCERHRAAPLRRRARARRRRHAVAPHAERPRAPRRRLPRGRPRAVRRAAARRQPRAQDLDRPARPRARLHAQPARGGPLPQDARGAHRLHDDAARRARRGGDRVRRGHHRRVRRPQARRRDLALDGARVRDGHRRSPRARCRPRAARCRTARASCATRSSSTWPTRRCAAPCGSSTSTATSSTRLASALLRNEVLERGDIDRIMEGVPRLYRIAGPGLRVVAAGARTVVDSSSLTPARPMPRKMGQTHSLSRAGADRAADFRGLLEPGAIRAVFQPIVRLSDLEPIGYEGLARFPSPPGLVALPPDVTLAAAARSGLRDDLEVACWAAMTGAGEPPHGRLLFVNVAPDALGHPGLAELAERLPSRLVIELTEQDAVQDIRRIQERLRPWIARGALVAVDDAGAGFTSLEYVAEIRPDFLKLCRGMVTGRRSRRLPPGRAARDRGVRPRGRRARRRRGRRAARGARGAARRRGRLRPGLAVRPPRRGLAGRARAPAAAPLAAAPAGGRLERAVASAADRARRLDRRRRAPRPHRPDAERLPRAGRPPALPVVARLLADLRRDAGRRA